MKTLGERIKHISSSNGGGNKFAEELGVSRRALENWFTNTTEPKFSQIIEIQKLSNKSLVWLLTGQEDEDTYESPGTEGWSHQGVDGEQNPHIEDPKYVDIMAQRKISPDIVKKAMRLSYTYIEENNLNVTPVLLSEIVASICHTAGYAGVVTPEMITQAFQILEKDQ